VVTSTATSRTARAPSAAERLRAAVAALGVPFGLERSVRFEAGRALRDRALCSVSLAAFAPDARAGFAAFCASLGAPEHALAALRPYVGAARHAHFGTEADAEGLVLKAYLEFADPPPRDRDLVFLAGKWRAEDPARWTLSRYFRRPPPLGVLVGRLAPPEVAPVVHRLLSRAGPHAQALEVREPGTPRRSLDLTLYDAGLTLSDAAEEVTALHAALGPGAPAARDLLAREGAARLGHVAAGLSRGGKPFATLYFGAGPG
jgi:tryptophan halogenase